MKLLSLQLYNYKRFGEIRLDFCKGLNLIWGPNESGKSTIHEAISCALFGRERGRMVENWNGGTCQIGLTYSTGGKTFRIERRLTEGKSSIGTLNGDELIDTISSRDEIQRLITAHIGIASKAVFDNTVSIRQCNVSRLGASEMEHVGNEIQRLLTGTAHVSASEVLTKLEAGRDDIKGKARPSNPREYDRVSERLRKLADDLANMRRTRQNVRNLEEEYIVLKERISVDFDRVEHLGKLLEQHKRYSELKEKEQEIEEHHKDVFSTLKKIKNLYADLESTNKDLEDHAMLVGKADEIADSLTKVGNRRRELQSRLAELKIPAGDLPKRRKSCRLCLLGGVLFALAGLILGFSFDLRFLLLLLPSTLLAIRYMQLRMAGGSENSGQLVEISDSTNQELKQLDAEEQNILSYMKCTDPGIAWMKIKTYRSMTARVHEMELVLNTLLSGKKLGDWETQETDLERELSSIKRELKEEFPDYSPTTEEVESWRSEYAGLQNSLPRAQARLHEVLGSLDTGRQNTSDLAALEGELDYLHNRKDELEFTYKAYCEAISALNAVTQTVSEKYLPSLAEHAGDFLFNITFGRYDTVHISQNWEINVDGHDKSAVAPSVLSIGTLDQLYFALRVACGKLLSMGRQLPLIIDDPFVSFDRGRLDSVLKLLKTLAAENQILLLTHDPYILDWIQENINASDVSIHKLDGPSN